MTSAPPTFSFQASNNRLWALSALILGLGLPLLTGSLLAWHSLGELDVWLHQKTGQEILAGHGIPHTNQFSFTEPEHPWTDHEWLFQVLIAATGPSQDNLSSGIYRWIWLRLFLTLGLIAAVLVGDRLWLAPPHVLFWLTPGLVLGVLLLWPRLLLRPELLSYAFLAMITQLAQKKSDSWSSSSVSQKLKSPESRALGLTVLWAQFHGFSALAPLIWLLGGSLAYLPGSSQPRPPIKKALGMTGLLVLALLLTPNGIQGLLYPLRALGQFHAPDNGLSTTISELQPLLSSRDSLGLTILLFKLSLPWGLLVALWPWPRISWLRLTLWIAATLATLFAQRNLGFYAITFLMLHTHLFQESSGGYSHRLGRFHLPRSLALAPLGLALAMVLVLTWQLVTNGFYLSEGDSRRFGGGATVARYPFQATELLARKPDQRTMANIDAAALVLDLGRAQPFVDGRTEAYSPEIWRRYRNLQRGGSQALAILDEYQVESVLLAIGGGSFKPLLETLQASPHWQLRFAEPAGALWTRASQAAGPALTDFTRFPAPQSHLGPVRQADLLAAQANLCALAGKPDQQETLLRQGLALCPHHPLLNHNLGNILLQAGQPRAALSNFRRALKTNPWLGSSALNAGVCLMKLGEFSLATDLLARAARLHPGSWQARANLSLAWQKLGRHHQALAAMRQAVALNPGNPKLQQALHQLQTGP